MFYRNEQECEYAYLSLHRINGDLQFPIPDTLAANAPPPHLVYSGAEDKIARNIATRFKSTKKFTGELGDDINEHIGNYLDAANDYKLENLRKLQYFHNIFDGEAKRFYRQNVMGVSQLFIEACTKKGQKYNTITRQNRVRKRLQSLRLSSIVRAKSCTTTEALQEL